MQVLLGPSRRGSRGNLCVCVCKISVLRNEELRPFIETQNLILTFIQTIDIGLGQRWMKNETECILS